MILLSYSIHITHLVFLSQTRVGLQTLVIRLSHVGYSPCWLHRYAHAHVLISMRVTRNMAR